MAMQLICFPTVPRAVGAIVSIKNDKTGTGKRSCTWSLKDVEGWQVGYRKYTNNLIIITNSNLVGPIQIQQALYGSGIVLGNTYVFPVPEQGPGADSQTLTPIETDTGSFIQSITLNETGGDGKQWEAIVDYHPYDMPHELGQSQPANASFDPTVEAPKVIWSAANYQQYYPSDINGKPFINTVGDPLENPPPREEKRQTLSFERNETVYNDTYAQQYRESVNSDTFLGFQPGQARCKDIIGERIYTADYGYYWKVKYEFEFRIAQFKDSDGNTVIYGFEEVILNAGFRQLDPNTNKPAQIIINGSPISQAVPLNQAGQYNPTDNPYYLVFTNYPSQTFANLNIPPDVLTANQ